MDAHHHEAPPPGAASPPTVPHRGKHGRLEGGGASEEALSSSGRVLQRTHTGSRMGLQQFFAPPQAAQLAAAVLGGRTQPVLDPTAGDGGLLATLPAEHRFGVEIDSDHLADDPYQAIHGDLQHVYPLLRTAGLRWPAVAVNPPFGLDWTDPALTAGKAQNSTLLAFRYSLRLLEEHGQGMLICGRDRYTTEIAPHPDAAGVYAVIDVDDLFAHEQVRLACSVVFFVQPDNRRRDGGDPERWACPVADLADQYPRIVGQRGRHAGHVTSRGTFTPADLAKGMRAVRREHDLRRQARGRQARYDVTLKAGKLGVHLGAFATLAVNERGLLREVQALDRQACSYFALNLKEWRRLRELEADGALSIDPALAGQVEEDTARAYLDSCPLYEVRPQMRLGFVADGDFEHLRCTRNDPDREFRAGERYDMWTRSKVVTSITEKVKRDREGVPQVKHYQEKRRLLELHVGQHTFDESPDSIRYLLEHFDLPDPGDLGSRHPEQVDAMRQIINQIEGEITGRLPGFQFKKYQVEDLARLACKGSGILAWQMGGGKTVGKLTLAELAVRLGRKHPQGAADRVLFVVPQDLIPQWQREARRFLGRELEVIHTLGDAHRAARRMKAGETGWFITHMEALSVKGRRHKALPVTPVDQRWTRDPVTGKARRTFTLTTEDCCPQCRSDTGAGWNGEVCGPCGYVHRSVRVRTGHSHLATAFSDGVICLDEGTLIKGADSLRSKAVRGLRARRRYLATGTPISNYVADLFWLAWWALGNASARFPYDYEGGQAKWEADFCVVEHLISDKEGEEGKLKNRRLLPEVTNLSMLWRLLSMSMVRRRTQDFGEPLVERTVYPVTVPMSQQQAELQRKWMADFERFFTAKHPGHPLVDAGLVKRFEAALGLLWKLEFAATLPEADPDLAWVGVPASNWTAKNLKVLDIALERVTAGDKVLIGSDLIETGRFIADQLQAKGVRAVHIVEERAGKAATKNPRARAAEVTEFMHGDAQVLCAGVNALKLGHNLDRASTVILTGLPWSHEGLEQFLGRVHRLTSEKPVSVYVVMVRDSLDTRKWGLLNDKGAAADLALDGELIEQNEEPVDWEKVLKEMRRTGITVHGDEPAEADLEAQWQARPPLPGTRPLRPAPRPNGPPELEPITSSEQLDLFAV